MINVLIKKKKLEAPDIVSFELTSLEGEKLPDATPGAHIDVCVSSGMTRQYSIYNDPQKTDSYKIAVLKDSNSRGGSVALHEDFHEGDVIGISAPRNLFELNNEAPSYILVAGGIGITPILSMADRLQSEQRSFSLHYFARNIDKAAFYDQIISCDWADKSSFYFDDEEKESFHQALLNANHQAHLYVCGPNGFMEFVFSSARKVGWSEFRLHKEHFSSAPREDAENQAFDVEIASSGERFHIPEGRSVFEVLDDAGVDVNVSCEQGICGSCLIRVISGVPDHRDQFLSNDERAKNDQFTPCCSRSLTKMLVLDL